MSSLSILDGDSPARERVGGNTPTLVRRQAMIEGELSDRASRLLLGALLILAMVYLMSVLRREPPQDVMPSCCDVSGPKH